MYKKIIFCSLILFSGCTIGQVPQVKFGNKELSSELQKVQEVFQQIENKEDKLTIYKLFVGSGEFLSHCESIESTSQFDPILGRVQSSYGWDRERYPEFTDAVSDYLVSVEYDEPKQLESRRDREEFAKIFTELAEAVKYE